MKKQVIELLISGAIAEGIAKLQSIEAEDLKQLSGTELVQLENFLIFLDDIIPTPDIDITRNSQLDKSLQVNGDA